MFSNWFKNKKNKKLEKNKVEVATATDEDRLEEEINTTSSENDLSNNDDIIGVSQNNSQNEAKFEDLTKKFANKYTTAESKKD